MTLGVDGVCAGRLRLRLNKNGDSMYKGDTTLVVLEELCVEKGRSCVKGSGDFDCEREKIVENEKNGSSIPAEDTLHHEHNSQHIVNNRKRKFQTLELSCWRGCREPFLLTICCCFAELSRSLMQGCMSSTLGSIRRQAAVRTGSETLST